MMNGVVSFSKASGGDQFKRLLIPVILIGIVFSNGFLLYHQMLATAALELLAILLIKTVEPPIHRPELKQIKPLHAALIALTFASLLMAVFGSENPDIAFIQSVKAGFIFVHFIFLISLTHYFLMHQNAIKLTLLAIACACACIAIIHFYDSAINLTPQEAFAPFFSKNIRHLGFIATAGIVISCCALAYSRNPLPHLAVHAFNLFFSFAFLIWLGGRTSIAVALLSVFTILGHACLSKAADKKGILTLLTVLCLSTGFEVSIERYSWNGINRTLYLFSDTDQQKTANELSSNRLEMWQHAWRTTLQSPVLGHGPESYVISEKPTDNAHPHNLFLQLAYDYGLPMALIALYILPKIIAALVQQTLRSQPDPDRHAALHIIVALTLNSLTSGAYYFPHSVALLMLCFAYCAAARLRQHKSQTVTYPAHTCRSGARTSSRPLSFTS